MQNLFVAHLLQGKLHCVHELCTQEQIVGTKHLRRNSLPQMDN
jgi:hypothetical protein